MNNISDYYVDLAPCSCLERVELAETEGFLMARKDQHLQMLNKSKQSSRTHITIPLIAWEALTYAHHNMTTQNQVIKASDIERTLKQFKVEESTLLSHDISCNAFTRGVVSTIRQSHPGSRAAQPQLKATPL